MASWLVWFSFWLSRILPYCFRLPLFSVTPVRCVSSSLFLRFWSLDAACDGAYESMHWATHAVGSWDLVDNARSLLVSFRVGGQGPWLS